METASKLVRIVTEAPTPHNNHFFEALAADFRMRIELNYIFAADRVPERPWKSLSESVPKAVGCYAGLGRWFSMRLIKHSLSSTPGVFFVIGWNHPLLYLLIVILGIRRANLMMWFDTPSPAGSSRAWRSKALLKRLIVHLINRTQGTVFVTGGRAEEQLQKMGVEPSKLSRLPFFVPVENAELSSSHLAELRHKFAISASSVVVLAAGRQIKSKGFDTLISAIALLDDTCRAKLAVVLVGSGTESTGLVNQVNELGLSSAVLFVPWVEPAVLSQYYAVADVFVAPARFDPFPTTVISAMQLGKPVVATEGVGSAVEFIIDGHNGLIVPAANPAKLASALRSVVDSGELRRRIGLRARQTMSEWSVDRGVDTVASALAKL